MNTLEFSSLSSVLDEIDIANNFQYITFRETTKMHLHSCSQMLDQSSVVLKFITKLDAGFSSVQKETQSLQETCNNLVQEQKNLSQTYENIDKNLEIFNNLEVVTKALNAPGSNLVVKDSFPGLLDKLDEGLVYVEKHKKFKDIERYQQRFRHCMTRALSLIQVYFQSILRNLATEIQDQSNKITNASAISVLLYSKFEAESSQLLKLTTEISKRVKANSEYEGLLNDCMKAYFSTRLRLLTPKIYKNLDESIKDPRDIVQFTRSLLSFYKDLCTQEYDLFQKIFQGADAAFMDWLVDLCSTLYDGVRQRIIREGDIGFLCELASLLLSYKEDDEDEDNEDLMSEDNVAMRWSANSINPLSPKSPTAPPNVLNDNQQHFLEQQQQQQPHYSIDYFELFKPILQDVQARLLFRVQAYVDQEIVRHVPTEDDLHGLSGRRKNKKGSKSSQSLTRSSSAATASEFDVDNIFIAWYPPMRKAISLLSQINQLVNSTTFDDLAHRIVHECLISLESAQKLAVTRLGRIEADLFLIKHLLILRNQILEFDIEYVPSDVHIDFSGISEVISLVRQGGVSLNRNHLLNLAKISVPKVVNNMFDAKEELYAKLRNTIHSFTEEAVQLIIKPITDPKCSPATALEDTRQLRENATNEIPRLRKLMLDNYIDDTRTVDILIDSIQDLVIQSYEKYHEQIIAQARKTNTENVSNEESEGAAGEIDGLMEVEGLIAWFADIVGSLHRDQNIIEDEEGETINSSSVI